MPASVAAHAAITLQNALWTIELRPDTLAIKATPAPDGPALSHVPDGGPGTEGSSHHGASPQANAAAALRAPAGVDVSRGGPAHRTQDVRATATQAAWQWDQGKYRVTARLDGRDLALSIQARDAGPLAILRQPAAAMGRALALPLAEGHYIAGDSTHWRDFLPRELAAFDTSADISLPLWTMDHGAYTLSWILENRYNNTAGFQRDGGGLAMSLDHLFTPLDRQPDSALPDTGTRGTPDTAPLTPMSLILHLGGPDPLAGAKRYRARLIEQGRYRRLEEKIRAVPLAGRLPGATHLYLWGNGLLADKDVRDWPGLLSRLQGDGGLSAALRARMDQDMKAAIRNAADNPVPAHRQWAMRAINTAFDALAREAWQTAAPDMHVLSRRYGELRREAAQAFGATLSADPARWGAGVSIDTIEALRRAGLQRLWIGLGEGWEGGLWHPEAIGAGADAGYLLAPYDSYETALPPGQQPSWASAQLGLAAYRDCGITRLDGRLQAGFQGAGHYTDPACVRPLLQARVRAILRAVPFNSWFLDVYATGMAFDNHAPHRALPQARYVAESAASLAWMTDTLHLPAGSEGGNAAADGILFAHGMQTPVIGWTDPDLQRNAGSPYFLGAWYPEDEPARFFKPVAAKPRHAAIHFDPAARLPLYQAVYHGAVITTHHWLFDNLKLRNVGRENTLVQLLYNVPPLFHLSAGTLPRRLPEIVRHDAFFRPLHERLATQALVEFSWLTADRRVQRTVFEDGTRLVANFRTTDFCLADACIPAGSIAAFLPGVPLPTVYRAEPARHGFPDGWIS
ncbi:hypothetical protein AKI39_23320 [Bordetella sp. H567]|nr:hypothetical protein AKI39_23320 [Bordetella sp. H567]